ncbi:MAG: DNA mismatch repair protein MutS [Nanoarchaeota archaeon]|nr:DNA mismatch repair protein MutS [Nanoarchaeota archaeon]
MVETNILNIPVEHLTPGMKQYLEAKRAHPDCVIMLRMGDFYEMFYEDAITAARELEITLTSRGKEEKKAPLAGIPYHALENYLGRLIKKGYKVAIIEQLEDPKQAKGLVKRGLVRIVTPGTVIESSLLNEKENNYIMSLTAQEEQFAAAFCDLSTGEFFTLQVHSLSHLLSLMVRFDPSEGLIPESLKVNTELVEKIKSYRCFLTSVDDHFFKPEKAKEAICAHFNIASLHQFGLEEEKQLVSAAGALLQYLHDTQKNTLSHLKNISIRSNDAIMLLDSSTIRNLELLKNIRDGSSRGTLLSVLDKTVTAPGTRLLKRWIKEPLLVKDAVLQRLDAVEALHQNIIAREEIISSLQETYDLERLISRVNYGNATPRDLRALAKSLQQIPLLKEKIKPLSGNLLQQIASMQDSEEVAALINKAVKEDAPITIREGGMIKPGYHQELDSLRDIKNNSKKYLQQLEEREKTKTGISTLKIGYTNVFGYFIEVTKKNIHLVPQTYIRKQTTANSERYITEELKIEEEKILGAEEKINELEYNLFQDIIKKVTLHTLAVQDAAQKLAVLDVLCSLAKTAAENNYVRPNFVDQKILHIKNGRHPVVEQLEKSFIANDVVLNEGEMMILTGPNMAGKSTVMRQTALMVLLAQMGSFVPAEEASLGIVDRIFTRVGAYDDLSSGQSTFMVEMHETASILHNATENSLIILDEIGRGTSTFDGVSIAWSVAEHIYNHTKAKTLFATHYHVLNKLAEKFSRIKNYNIAVKERHGEVIFLHRLIEGSTDQSYGIHVAKLAGLPLTVVERAKEIQAILEKDDEMMRKIKAKKLEEQKSLEFF